MDTDTPDKEATYLKDRLDDQLNWHDAKSIKAQATYKRIKYAEILLAAAVPVFALWDFEGHDVIAAVLGATVGVLAACQLLGKHQDLWHQYRATAEHLRRLKILYQAQCPPFDGEKRFCKLVEQVEGCLAQDNAQWLQLMKSQDKASPES